MAESLPHDALAQRADVAKLSEVKALVKRAHEVFGRVDIIVNNAGTSHPGGALHRVKESDFDRVFAVNVKSIYNFAVAAVPFMQERGGCFINIGSSAAIRPRPGIAWYNGTKGAVHIISKSMAVELAPYRIRVNVVAPVAGNNPLLTSVMGQDSPENREHYRASIPLGRFSTPRDIANAALFLASDEASLITGTVLEVDGGRCI
jgi:3-oxoacyl-[acyl-carrier protein] reductase